VGRIDDVVAGTHHVGEREVRLRERSRDRRKAIAGLRLDAFGHLHGYIIVAGGAGHEGEIAIDDGAAIARELLERPAGGDEAASHTRLGINTLALFSARRSA